MEHGLAQVDDEGAGGYLEAQNEDYLGYDRRVGCELRETLRPVETGPPMYTSRRRPRYPIEPSICSSIRRDHSTAYSMGNVRVTGSMNPFTIMPMAWLSVSPRLMR